VKNAARSTQNFLFDELANIRGFLCAQQLLPNFVYASNTHRVCGSADSHVPGALHVTLI
jgi:hypothetical protein